MEDLHNIKNLKIVQWNARGVQSKSDILRRHSNTGDIFLISETKLKGDEGFKFNGFDVIKWSRENERGGGVAILIRNSVKYEKYHLDLYKCEEKLEACAINIFTHNRGKITIVSCYRPPDAQHMIDKENGIRFSTSLSTHS